MNWRDELEARALQRELPTHVRREPVCERYDNTLHDLDDDVRRVVELCQERDEARYSAQQGWDAAQQWCGQARTQHERAERAEGWLALFVWALLGAAVVWLVLHFAPAIGQWRLR